MKPRAFKRIWGKPWDYKYLLKLEQYKIREMCEYIKKHHHLSNWEFVVRDLEICNKLIDIIQEEDQHYTSWLNNCYGVRPIQHLPFPIYVNTRNYKRFCRYECPWSSNMIAHWQADIRQKKALYLYNKIRSFRMFYWWD